MSNILMLGSIPPPYGGVSVHVENLCRELSKTDNVFLLADRPSDNVKSNVHNGYKVYRPLVTVPTAGAPVSVKDLFDTMLLNIRCYRVDCIKTWAEYVLCAPMIIHYGSRVEAEMLYALPLHEILKTKNIDVIHAHHASSRAYRALLATKLKGKKTPLVVTMHRGEFRMKNGRQRALMNYVFKNANKLIAASSIVKDLAIAFGAASEKIEVIPNGVDTRLFKPLENRSEIRFKYGYNEDRKIILFVGSLVKEKGIIDLLFAFRKSRGPKDLLLIVGDGPLRNDIYNIIASLSLGESVFLLGSMPNSKLVEIYNLVDVFVLPSYVEGLSVALLEAMSCGKPVITTYPSFGGLKHDAVKKAFNGVLVPAGDIDALSSALIMLINDEELGKKLGKNARRTALEKFDWSIIASRVQRIYQETVQ